jgi:hypothetical protein
MRNFLLALGCVAAASGSLPGCGPQADPQLAYKSITYGEGYAPLPFAVAVANDGPAAGHVDRVEATILSVAPIPGRGLTLLSPKDFQHEVHLFGHERAGVDAEPLPQGTAMTLPRHKISEVWCALEWTLPEDAPPMLVVCSASFRLSYRGDVLLETPAHAVVLQSQPGILENMTAAPVRSRRRAKRVVELLSTAPGEKSQGVIDLLEHMRQATQ